MVFQWVTFAISGETAINTAIYQNINDEIEQLSYRLSILVYGAIAPFLIFPAVFQSYYQYYVLEMGELSFLTPFPAS